MRLLSWNVNGLRAAQRAGFGEWFAAQRADVVCVQETKVEPEKLDDALLHPEGYHSYWHPAQKKGYSGVATYCRRKPEHVRYGLGNREFDAEGRVLITHHGDFVLVNTYFPNSQRGATRLDYKLRFCRALVRAVNRLRRDGHAVVICGDFNIAHKPIDLANPKANEGNAGYLPEERAWLDRFTRYGWVDSFRQFCSEPGHYTFWSQRMNVRARNIGWRLDYFFVGPELVPRLAGATIQPDVQGSDHCPVGLQLRRPRRRG